MTLKIGMVATCLNTQHIRGMGKYVFELLQQSQPGNGIYWHLFGNDPRYRMVTPADKALTSEVFEFKGDRFCLWEQMGLPLRAIRRNVDILHCTEGSLPLWQPRPTVVTIHDTVPWDTRPDTAFAANYYDRLLPKAMKRCAAIITISESSKTDMLARWPVLEKKLTVVPHGIEEAYFSLETVQVPEKLGVAIGSAPYIVYMGGAMERKRFNWALKVLARSELMHLRLVACGFNAEDRKFALAQLPQELRGRVLFAEFLTDAQLRALYRGSQAVLYPTLYEGFGFPAIEAQAAGVPVVFSALGSLKELIGPLALVVQPHDLDAWTHAVIEATSMGSKRHALAQQAAIWVRKFSWAKSFEKHREIYERVAHR